MRFKLKIPPLFRSMIAVSVMASHPGISYAQTSDLEDMAKHAHKRAAERQIADKDLVNEELMRGARRRVEGLRGQAAAPARDRAATTLGLDAEKLQNPDGRTDEPALYIFVSFSMSDSLIRQYVQDAVRYRGRVVIAGLHENSFKKTIEKVQSFVMTGDKEGQGGVLIDPKSFETFHITAVPTIVLAEQDLVPCLDAKCERNIPEHDRISGSVSLDYALGRFAADGDMKQAARARLSEGEITAFRSLSQD